MTRPAPPANPVAEAFARLLTTHPGLLAEPLSPVQSLDRRLMVAFESGWQACARRVVASLASGNVLGDMGIIRTRREKPAPEALRAAYERLQSARLVGER